ncbi:MAG: hypothetical protein FWE80_04975 [Oscillospiraceae bacterium]|nr:hypothetical protein [Oscillospiraceae bacterium]
MRKLSYIALAVFLFLFSLTWPLCATAAGYTLPDSVTCTARSAILIGLGEDPSQDVLLFKRDENTRRSPAAMAKLLMAAYAWGQIRERGLDIDAVTGTWTQKLADSISGTGLAVANMKVGNAWKLRDLLTVGLMGSAADCCLVLAATISESIDAFVSGMNDLAKELGCTNSRFTNVTGLDHADDEDNLLQYTTAWDMYLITRHVLGIPELTEILALSQTEVTPVEGSGQTYINANLMMRSGGQRYAPLVFGRTGYSDIDGRSIASVARQRGYDYLTVVIGTDQPDSDTANAHYQDSRALYTWAFDNFAYKTLLRKNEPVDQLAVELAWSIDKVILVTKEDIASIVDKSLDISMVRQEITKTQEPIDAPIEKGEVFGKVELYINMDQKVGECELVAAESIPRSDVLLLWRKVYTVITSPWLYLGILGILLLFGGYILLAFAMHKRRKNRKILNRR